MNVFAARAGGLLLLCAAAFCGVMPEAALAGSPFYLTVERSFSNTESPEIRLDYTKTTEPMVFRVLRAADTDAFLDGQLQISRSYEEPVTELNAGHYILRGMNKVKSPLVAAREALDVEFRKAFKKDRFNYALQQLPERPRVTPPDEMRHGPPRGFEVVREFTVDLDYGGSGAKDLGWWFGDNAWEEWRYKTRTIKLEPLADGLYLLQAVQENAEAQSLLQVSSLAVQVKQSSAQLLLRVVERNLKPLRNAVVSVRDGRAKWVRLPGSTDAQGELRFDNPDGVLDGKLVVKVTAADGRQVFADTDFSPVQNARESVFILTDRPVFKPGEQFFFKGVIREFSGGSLHLPELREGNVRVSIARIGEGPAGPPAVVGLTEFGTFSGAYELDQAAKPGVYRLVAEVEQKPFAGEFRVRDYVKPSFYLELIERSKTVVPGERFSAAFKVRRYSGAVPQNVKYEVYLYRKRFEAPSWVIEAGGALDAGSDYFGENRSAASLAQPQRIYSSAEARLAASGQESAPNTWASAPELDGDGNARIDFQVPVSTSSAHEDEWIYTLVIRAQDSAGSQAALSENIYMTLAEAVPAVRFVQSLAEKGVDDLELAVRTTYPDGSPAPGGTGMIDASIEGVGGEQSIVQKLRFTTDVQGYARVRLPEISRKGKLKAEATLESIDGKVMRRPAHSLPATLVVGADEGDAITGNKELELYASAAVLSPGEKARVLALLPAGWGKGERGTVWETFSGERIYSTRNRFFRGRSTWFDVEAKPEYGTGFYHTVTIPRADGKFREETVAFRIVDWRKRLKVNVAPQGETAEPLKPFRIALEVLDAEKRPVANAELGVSIVDRAVYAVQPEFRPEIVEFFYPLPRMNTATFYSDELQGYGYADLLRKPNFGLGALKTSSKLAKKSMRDTAGWFPHVVTDAQGKAVIDVDMPGNITQWLVSAVCVDPHGRLGEGRGSFRSSADVIFDGVLPQFLLNGDRVEGALRLSNQTGSEAPIRIRAESGRGFSLSGAGEEHEVKLAPKSENLLPLELTADMASRAGSVRVYSAGSAQLKLGGVQEFEVPLLEAAMRQTVGGKSEEDGLVQLGIPAAAQVEALRVQVSSGLLGVALGAARRLVSYPYGCTEQLVHTTIPNMMLLDLVERAGLKSEELGGLAEASAKARRHAEHGMAKLVKNQKADGGFSLWAGESLSSFPVTVMAASALAVASELKIEGAEQARLRAERWLVNNCENYDYAGGEGLSGYELAVLAELKFWDQPVARQIAFVEKQAADAKPRADSLIYALRIIKAYETRPWHRFNDSITPEIKDSLTLKLREALTDISFNDFSRSRAGDFAVLGFSFGPVELASGALGILAALNALPDDLGARLKRFIIEAMENGGWLSTFDTAQLIFNTRELIAEEARRASEFDRERVIRVRRKDRSDVGVLTPSSAGYYAEFSAPGAAAALAEVTLDGLRPDEAAYVSARTLVPLANVVPQDAGFEVERTLLRLTAKGAEVLVPGEALSRGDVVVSRIAVRRGVTKPAAIAPSEFVVVEDPLPALALGIEAEETYLADANLVQRESSYWSSLKDTLRYPERTERILRLQPGGRFEVYQVYRFDFAGKAALAPARVFDMYNESLHGHTAAQELEVR